MALTAALAVPARADADIPMTCAAPAGSAAADAIFDVPYRTDFGKPQHEDCTTWAGEWLDFGELNEPPIATAAEHRGVDLVAHWYNDFGLRLTTIKGNSPIWYDWSWNSPRDTPTDYDAARHPLLGFYRGDDPRVLGWIAYWLAAAGVNAVSFPNQNGFTTANWSAELDWEEAFLRRTPNAKALDWILAVGSSGQESEIRKRSLDLLEFAERHRENIATTSIDGEPWAVVNVFDLEAMRGVFDDYQGSWRTRAFLSDLGTGFREIGFGGVVVMARHAAIGAPGQEQIPNAKVVSSTYEGTYGTAATYGAYVADVEERYDGAMSLDPNRVLGVTTSAQSHAAHPSNWNMPGSTPSLFGENLQRTVRYVEDRQLMRMVTINNVSEWAEAGPGLVPQNRDGFGYLEAIRRVSMGGLPFEIRSVAEGSELFAERGTTSEFPNARAVLGGTASPGTNVRVLRQNGKTAGSAFTDRHGAWRLSADLQWGTWNLRAEERLGTQTIREIDLPRVTVRPPATGPLLVTSPAPRSSVAAPVGGTNTYPNARLRVTGTGPAGMDVVMLRASGREAGRSTIGLDGQWSFDADVTWGRSDLRVVGRRDGHDQVAIDLPGVEVTPA